MKFDGTPIDKMKVIALEPREDERGSFSRVFCKKELKNAGIEFDIKQINFVTTKKTGTLRGLHYQAEPTSEAKIFRCFKGRIYDVTVDVRKGSPTFGKWFAVELGGNDGKMVFIPEGCAHGYETLEDDCEVEYIMSEFYSPQNERGISWNDSFFNIQWPMKNPLLSEKDKNWPPFSK